MDYRLSASAEADLRGIIRHTRKHWGDAQVRRYIGNLERGIACLAAGKGAFNDMGDVYPALRMARCGKHYVFCLPREGEPALILAILHERMDLIVRLAERLQSR